MLFVMRIGVVKKVREPIGGVTLDLSAGIFLHKSNYNDAKDHNDAEDYKNVQDYNIVEDHNGAEDYNDAEDYNSVKDYNSVEDHNGQNNRVEPILHWQQW